MRMKNFEVARILRNISILLDMDDVPFKPRAYEKAALSIEALEDDVEQIYQKGGLKALKQIPGVGESIAEKIEEIIKTGKLEYYEELSKKAPVDLESLSGIEGLGPKKIKVLWQKLKIKNGMKNMKCFHSNKYGKLSLLNLIQSPIPFSLLKAWLINAKFTFPSLSSITS